MQRVRIRAPRETWGIRRILHRSVEHLPLNRAFQKRKRLRFICHFHRKWK